MFQTKDENYEKMYKYVATGECFRRVQKEKLHHSLGKIKHSIIS